MIRKEAWPLYRTISGVRLCWELEEPKEPKGLRGIDPILDEHPQPFVVLQRKALAVLGFKI